MERKLDWPFLHLSYLYHQMSYSIPHQKWERGHLSQIEFEVKFRDAELCKMFDSDYRIRLHRSRGDSGQGEAERTNSAIGDSVVDGATIEWEKYKQFEGVSEEKINQLSVKEFEEMEVKRMEKNAWNGAKLLVDRVDGAPVLRERIKAHLSEDEQGQFFFILPLLLLLKIQFQVLHTSKRSSSSLMTIIELENSLCIFSRCHAKIKCDFCMLWNGIPTTRVPQPVPEPMRPSKFLNVSITPTHKENGEEREVVDWQPRANITMLFKEGKINIAQGELVAVFADKLVLCK